MVTGTGALSRWQGNESAYTTGPSARVPVAFARLCGQSAQAAGCADSLAGYPCRVVGGEEDHHRSDLVRLSKAGPERRGSTGWMRFSLWLCPLLHATVAWGASNTFCARRRKTQKHPWDEHWK